MRLLPRAFSRQCEDNLETVAERKGLGYLEEEDPNCPEVLTVIRRVRQAIEVEGTSDLGNLDLV